MLLLDYARKTIDGASRSTCLIGYALRIKAIRRHNLAVHLFQEFHELGRFILIAPHKLTLKEIHHFCAERLEVLMFLESMSALGPSYDHSSSKTCQKLIDISEEILE